MDQRPRQAQSESSPGRGEVPLPNECDQRLSIGVAIAGVLAELGVQHLEIDDPRCCRPRSMTARECNLPREIAEAAPGTTIRTAGLAMLIDADAVRWVGEGPLIASMASMQHRTARPA